MSRWGGPNLRYAYISFFIWDGGSVWATYGACLTEIDKFDKWLIVPEKKHDILCCDSSMSNLFAVAELDRQQNLPHNLHNVIEKYSFFNFVKLRQQSISWHVLHHNIQKRRLEEVFENLHYIRMV